LPKFQKIWVDLVQEEIRSQTCLEKQREVDVIFLVGKMKKCSKSKFRDIGNKDLTKVMCFQCHDMGHYAS